MSAETQLTEDYLRQALGSFWNKILEVESVDNGLVFTMPAAYPDGWQVVLELRQKTPKGFYLSDRGKTLTWLTGQGQNTQTDAMKHHIERLLAEHTIKEEKGVLYRWLQAPLDMTDLQVFAEG